jgi:7,8-dihydropterin-6-yl-methyl-4-(beta-D-ribofuranosyl)aminobenzene 5'-phosphate synthase
MMADGIEITVLVDDQAGTGLRAEHGLALWIVVGEKRILLDTGQGAALVLNARQLGVPLEETDIVVLSHGHYDHTGGLTDVLALAPKARLVLHPDASATRYSVAPSRTPKGVGMPEKVCTLIDEMDDERVMHSRDAIAAAPFVGVTGPIVRRTSFEHTSGPFFLDEAGQRPDPIVDDQALWIATPKGLIVCVGCCHAGLVNTLDQVRRLSGTLEIRAVIGGLHLMHADSERLRQTIEALRAVGPDLLVPCHCTGSRAVARLQEALGGRVAPCRSGATFRFDRGE